MRPDTGLLQTVAPLDTDQGSDDEGGEETYAEVKVHSQGDLLMIELCQNKRIHRTTSHF